MRPHLFPPAWMELPVLDETRCTGCGTCVAICPTACLEMRAVLPWMRRPADCIACAACALACPTEALSMKSAAVLPSQRSGS